MANSQTKPWFEDHGHCLIVHNRHTKRGALTPEFYEIVRQAITVANSTRVRSIIIAGGPFFCAGGDLEILKSRAAMPIEKRREKIEGLHNVIRAMKNCDVPIIAAIEGGAAGAGFSIASMCDLIVAAKNSTFTAAYVKAGLTPDGGLTHTLTQKLPHQMAMEMCLFGRPFTAEILKTYGIVSELSAEGDALKKAKILADALALSPPQAVSRIRRLISEAQDTDFQSHLDREADLMAESQGSAEAKEGVSAFFEKRKPIWPL